METNFKYISSKICLVRKMAIMGFATCNQWEYVSATTACVQFTTAAQVINATIHTKGGVLFDATECVKFIAMGFNAP